MDFHTQQQLERKRREIEELELDVQVAKTAIRNSEACAQIIKFVEGKAPDDPLHPSYDESKGSNPWKRPAPGQGSCVIV